jgi:hypothetical protein
VTRVPGFSLLDRYAARYVNFVLVVLRIAVLGARSAPKDTGNQPRARPGYHGQSPWLVGCLATLGVGLAAPAGAPNVESVGVRAPGIGGAFVAVANHSSATWWNPAGLAAGPFLDLAIARSVTEQSGSLPAGRDRIWSF